MKWYAAYAENRICKNEELKSIRDIKNSGYDIIEASVPGNFELDMIKLGKFPDFYYSDNSFEAQKYENLHIWYFCEFETEDTNQYIRFGGIDTVADIFVNGEFVRSVENMFMSYDIFPDIKKGKNEIVVHIKPVVIEARKYARPAISTCMHNNAEGLYIRKAPHSYGWDIMPRLLTTGLWKDVELKKIKADKITDVYFATKEIDCKNSSAMVECWINANIEGDFSKEYSVRVKGNCEDSVFFKEETLFHTDIYFHFTIENCRLWWPKNAGKPYLYDVSVELYKNGILCDTKNMKIGVRTVELIRTEITDSEGNGDFRFEINEKPVFVMGTNWVPLDAFHSNDENRLNKAMELLLDVGCNCVRCWGGNVYESDRFYEMCDENGIMVWQDFSMACSIYPNEDIFYKKIREEAVFQVKRLRNHPCLILWAGDNECDNMYVGAKRNPAVNKITREVLKHVVEIHDMAVPYLPCSPYISTDAYEKNGILPEDHLWGPRDYFKGEYYRNSRCHFASETGYHGFPSVSSLKKFLKNPEKLFNDDGTVTDEYLAHATCMAPSMDDLYAYRIGLAYSQVETLFGKSDDNIYDFVKKSQISQAEAKKYFIEKFRIGKWYRTGIIWWNLIDGWPQVSDAVVDYYYTEKLAYNYIKRSQSPVCLMFDEPVRNISDLYGVNDLPIEKQVSYSVTRVSDGAEIIRGSAVLKPDSSEKIAEITITENEKEFYLISWIQDGKEYKNHYFSNIIDIDYEMYCDCLKKSNMYEFK